MARLAIQATTAHLIASLQDLREGVNLTHKSLSHCIIALPFSNNSGQKYQEFSILTNVVFIIVCVKLRVPNDCRVAQWVVLQQGGGFEACVSSVYMEFAHLG